MSKFDGVFDRRPSMHSASKSVQSSLYGRLSRIYGASSGGLAWLLVRCAQPSHRDHLEALQAVVRRPSSDLDEIAQIARATLVAPAIASRPETTAMAAEIVRVIEAASLSRRAIESGVLSGVAPNPLKGTAEEWDAVMARMEKITARSRELIAAGMSRVDADAQAMREIP